jgi:hypothetical protein
VKLEDGRLHGGLPGISLVPRLDADELTWAEARRQESRDRALDPAAGAAGGAAARRRLAALAAAVALLALVAGAALLGLRTVRAVVPLLEHNVHVIAYLGDELGPASASACWRPCARVPGVERARAGRARGGAGRCAAAADSLGSGAVAGIEPGFLAALGGDLGGGRRGDAGRTAELAARPAQAARRGRGRRR